MKGQLDATDWFFYWKTYCLLNMFRATIMPIIRSSRVIQMAAACGTWLFGLQVVGLVWSCGLCLRDAAASVKPNQTRKPKNQVPQAAAICITLELLMTGIMVPETCWANKKFCNKKTKLLHLAGLLCLRINDDARSKSHQVHKDLYCVTFSFLLLVYHRQDIL